jgi:hypothetical protein
MISKSFYSLSIEKTYKNPVNDNHTPEKQTTLINIAILHEKSQYALPLLSGFFVYQNIVGKGD